MNKPTPHQQKIYNHMLEGARKALLLEVNGRRYYNREYYISIDFSSASRVTEVFEDIAVTFENGRIDVTLTDVGGAVTHHTFMGQIHILWGEVRQ